MTKYTEDEIAGACMKSVEDWDTKALVRNAVDGLFYFYLDEASEDQLDEFMKEYKHEQIYSRLPP